jgi:hypothetical protein
VVEHFLVADSQERLLAFRDHYIWKEELKAPLAERG